MTYPPPGYGSPLSNSRSDSQWTGAENPSSARYFSYNTYLRDDSGLPSPGIKAFSITQTGAAEVMVNGGFFTIHGLFSVKVDGEASMELTGQTSVVYVECFLFNKEASIRVANTRPESTNTHVFIPLATYRLISSSSTGEESPPRYIVSIIHHDGDIHLGSYIR